MLVMSGTCIAFLKFFSSDSHLRASTGLNLYFVFGFIILLLPWILAFYRKQDTANGIKLSSEQHEVRFPILPILKNIFVLFMLFFFLFQMLIQEKITSFSEIMARYNNANLVLISYSVAFITVATFFITETVMLIMGQHVPFWGARLLKLLSGAVLICFIWMFLMKM